ncbi:MAG: agmatinase family protein [Prevotellaceae bacterium]|jgi:agmatinase|nr:agmatinase family protein [Prevotellaceae bacterium]
MEHFNPNDIGLPNGNFFALPYSVDESEIVLISAPWDVTASYRCGTANAPQRIIAASSQIDIYDIDVENAWKIKIGTHPYDDEIFGKSTKLRKKAEKVIAHLENGGNINDISILHELELINKASEKLNVRMYEYAKKYYGENKITGIVGGEHSVPFGLIKFLSEKYDNLGILHIDAHADLRHAYEGFEYSHASIMYNVITKCKNVAKLVQVGIRDFCTDEADLIAGSDKISAYTDFYISEQLFGGEQTWKSICNNIINELPENVYISFDIDGLSPELCPNTGTPVPGGLSFQQAYYLLRVLSKSGRKIAGFDVCEVAPNPYNDHDEYDANVGARILYKICCLAHLSNIGKHPNRTG